MSRFERVDNQCLEDESLGDFPMYEISDEECVAPTMDPTPKEPVEDLSQPEEIPQPEAI